MASGSFSLGVSLFFLYLFLFCCRCCRSIRVPVLLRTTSTSLKFYVHDDYNTTEVTNVHVAGPPFFDPRIENGTMGAVSVIDDLVTEGSARSSPALGRAQGMTINCALALDTTCWSFTVSFTAGKFSGSTLSVQGLDRYYVPGRELSVIGGTGNFRSANGYLNMYTVSVANGTSLFLFTGEVRTPTSF